MGSYSPPPAPREGEPVYRGTEPQILPPGTANMPQPVRRQRRSWMVAPATYFLIGINCVVFLLMVFRHVGYLSPSPDDLLTFGANNAGSVLINNEWWRIVTAMFVHVGIIHLATNMWCLWNLGMLAEPLMGSLGVLAVYILTGAAGNLLSVFVTRVWFYDPSQVVGGLFGPVGAGASGAVFGIAGALIVLLKSHWLPIPAEELSKLRKSVIYFAGINLVIGLATIIPGSFVKIDNMAHMGGCACGLLFAAPMVPGIGAPKKLFFFRRRIAIGLVVLTLTLFAFFIASFQGQ
jgi:rhomboid protease GluP